MTSEVAGPASHDFIQGLPKAELHVHHVGSASARIVSELADPAPRDGAERPRRAASAFFEFRDFAHFIEVYLAVVALIRTPEDIHYLTYEVAREMATEQGLRYAELTCTPYTSVRPDRPDRRDADRGATPRRSRPPGSRPSATSGWCCAGSTTSPASSACPSADATLDYALDHRPEGLVGFGLGGPEIGVPRPQFQPHFERPGPPGCTACRTPARPPARRRSGTRSTLLQAERIGHGTSSAQDPALLAAPGRDRRPARGLPVVQHRHPGGGHASRSTRSGRSATPGVTVTVNSDDPPMFGTTLNREYAIAADLLGLDEAGLAELARTAVRASFAPEDVRDAGARRDRRLRRRLSVRPATGQ